MDPAAPTTLPMVEREGAPEKGMALCLSGGGYRAMLFHVGALWRLNEVGLLARLARVSSVSGGSITAGVLGLKWRKLGFAGGVAGQFVDEVVTPIRGLAGRTIDRGAIVTGALLPVITAGDRIEAAYRKHLFGGATLQDLPGEGVGPRFVINASNVQSGALWRFSRPYMRDWRVGKIASPQVALAKAVAASSAFPPFLSPVKLDLQASDYEPGSGEDLQIEPYTTDVVLTDGGVYDNLGLETAWKQFETILVSDAGGKLDAEAEPKEDWPRHAYRVLELIDNQVRALRKRQLLDAYRAGRKKGAYFGIRTDVKDYGLTDALPAPLPRTLDLASTPTRLKAIDAERQERLINWGYVVCDAALRAHVMPASPVPKAVPYDRAI